MTKAMTFDELMEAKDRARHRADERAEARAERRERQEERDRQAIAADPRVGRLQRGAATVFYVYPVGGKYREAADPLKLARYL